MTELKALTAWEGKEDELWRTSESLQNEGWIFESKRTEETDYGTYIVCVLIKSEPTLLEAATHMIYRIHSARRDGEWLERAGILEAAAQLNGVIEREEQIQENTIQPIPKTTRQFED